MHSCRSTQKELGLRKPISVLEVEFALAHLLTAAGPYSRRQSCELTTLTSQSRLLSIRPVLATVRGVVLEKIRLRPLNVGSKDGAVSWRLEAY